MSMSLQRDPETPTGSLYRSARDSRADCCSRLCSTTMRVLHRECDRSKMQSFGGWQLKLFGNEAAPPSVLLSLHLQVCVYEVLIFHRRGGARRVLVHGTGG